MAKQKHTKIKKPEDFKPETHFPEDWKVKGYGGEPRCPAWSGQKGAQCGQIAGSGTKNKGKEGACCKYHGGASDGAPKGNTNAVNPDGPHSQYIRIEDIDGIGRLMGKDVIDQADLLSALTMHRIELALGKEKTDGDDNAAEKVDAKLTVMGKMWSNLARTKVAAQGLLLRAPEPEDDTLTDEELEQYIFGDPGAVPGDAEGGKT